MTELSNEPTLHEDDPGTERKPAPGVMLISILLLIVGFLLASAMLLHYGMEGNGETGNPIPGLAQTLEKAKSMVAATKTDPETPAPAKVPEVAAKPKESGIKGLFPAKSGNVRWPRLELAGFGIPAAGETGFAIINGKHVVVGGEIKGATLVEILGHGVLLEYKGETKTLSIELAH